MDFWRFAEPGFGVGAQISGVYNPLLVGVSLGLSCLAGIAALLVVDRIQASHVPANRRSWLRAGAVAMGAGIWSMHFTGMLAYTLPASTGHGLLITALSILPAVIGSGFALYFIQSAKPRLLDWRLQAGAALMAAGIGSMHYIGMEAMQVGAELRYVFTVFVVSLIFAHVLAMIAILVHLELGRNRGISAQMAPIAGGVVLGLAVAAMHYTAMYAASFHALPEAGRSYGHIPPALLASTIIGFTILILAITIMAAWADSLRQVAEETARTDPVTGLPNQQGLKQYLDEVMVLNRAESRPVYLLVFGINDFYSINSSLGHDAGDSVLEKTAARLEATLKDGFFLASLAGDEFAIVLGNDISTREGAASFAEEILKTVELPVTVSGLKLYLRAGAGISTYEGEDTDSMELIDQAHKAMRVAKFGRQSYRFFTNELSEYAREQVWMKTELQDALTNGQLELLYQPQVELASGNLVGLEALVRWHHPERGWILPQNFIPVIDNVGMMLDLDEFVLEQACVQIKKWAEAGLHVGHVAVNLSPQYLEQPNALNKLGDVLEKTGLPGRYLQLEVTEARLLRYDSVIKNSFVAIQKMGITLAIDDFGTGYSSLSYLNELPVDKLKLDQSFVKGLTTDPKSHAIPRAVVGMAKGLGLGLIAEGIETEEQRRVLLELGYEEGQGYFYAQPLSVSEVPHIGTDAVASGIHLAGN